MMTIFWVFTLTALGLAIIAALAALTIWIRFPLMLDVVRAEILRELAGQSLQRERWTKRLERALQGERLRR